MSRMISPSAEETWKHLAFTVGDGAASPIQYLNGASQAVDHLENTDVTNRLTHGGDGVNIGRLNGSSGYFDGLIDELRISRIVRSADWIATSYNTMNDPATFMTIGPQEPPDATNADINCEVLTGYAFGSACVLTCSAEHTWTVTNEGTDPLIGSIGLTGTNPGEFVFTQGDGAFTLNPSSLLKKDRWHGTCWSSGGVCESGRTWAWRWVDGSGSNRRCWWRRPVCRSLRGTHFMRS